MHIVGQSSIGTRMQLLPWALLMIVVLRSGIAQGDLPNTFMKRMTASMAVMDRSMMSAPMTGNVDHDFAAMMIPHHQGAIDMAKAELLFGKDRTMRRLAQEILVDQKSEIDAMNLWLAKQPAAPLQEKSK